MRNKLIALSTTISLTFGLLIFSLIQDTKIPTCLNGVITILTSSAFYQLLINIFYFIGNHVDFVLKIFWGKVYLKGFWSYKYIVDNENKYGAWIIEQSIDEITIKGFGLSPDGTRRSDVQSISPLIKRVQDYEIVNTRRDVNEDGTWTDTFFYSKTSLHFISRKTFLGLFNYPLEMEGTTIVFGGALSGKSHTRLRFRKHIKVKNERELEKEILQSMNEE